MDRRKSRLMMPPGRANTDLDAYLERIYQYNKATVDKVAYEMNNEPGVMEGWGISGRTLFFENVKGHMELTGDGVRAAVEKFGRTELFLNRTERRLNNVEKTLRGDPELLRRIRKANGWKNKLDWDILSITADQNIYRLGNIYISF